METTKRRIAVGQRVEVRGMKAQSLHKAQHEAAELDTIDRVCISDSARVAAIKRGAGVMIGDYFVGVTTGTDLLFNHPGIVY